MCDLDPKVKVIGKKAGICDGVSSTAALVFYYLTALIFSGSYVRFMSCHKPCYIVFKPYTVKALARVCICASSSEPSLLTDLSL